MIELNINGVIVIIPIDAKIRILPGDYFVEKLEIDATHRVIEKDDIPF